MTREGETLRCACQQMALADMARLAALEGVPTPGRCWISSLWWRTAKEMVMHDTYILDGTRPVRCPDPATWRRWFETADCTVARTTLAPDVEVRTMFLGVDQSWDGGRPLLFDTVVFGGPLDGEMERSSTWSEAEAGHAAMCARVREAVALAGRPPAPPGSLCEVCLDAPAVALQPAPWGDERGVCAACAGLPPAVPTAAWDAVPACLICAQPPGPDEDATAYVQHCFDTGHPLRPGEWQLQRGTRIYL